jgi:hypothetical protein
MEPEGRLRALYAAFNARDMETALAGTAKDVDWPNGWEGGRERGRDAVRAYWSRQWGEIDPHVQPLSITTQSDGRVAVEVHQVVRDLRGKVLSDARVIHVYLLSDGLVARMDIEDPV